MKLPKKGEILWDRWGTKCTVEYSGVDMISVREADKNWDSFTNPRVDITSGEFKYYFPNYEAQHPKDI